MTPVLGTASQAPTRARNHNGYFLRWDDEGLLFIMDTRLCDAAFELAEDADLVVCESTFADADAALADDYGHLTAGQAGLIARAAGARRLVLTHFSQRYQDATLLLRDAAAAYDGDIVLAGDLDRIPVPPRETAR